MSSLPSDQGTQLSRARERRSELERALWALNPVHDLPLEAGNQLIELMVVGIGKSTPRTR